MNFVPAVLPDAAPSALAWCFSFAGGRFLWPESDAGEFEPQRELPHSLLTATRHYLGRLDGLDAWALTLHEPPPGWAAMPLRVAMTRFPEPLAALAGRAAQVIEWDRAHRFCGVCATPTELRGGERARICPSCGHIVYPRLSPAMMALVWRGNEILLARSPQYPADLFSALAGFVEAGESIEDCVRREVAEEVGLQVGTLRYYGSQSWPFPHSLMVAYTAEWVGGEIVPQPGEIEEARWFAVDALPNIPPRFSIAGHLIRDTAARLRQGPLD